MGKKTRSIIIVTNQQKYLGAIEDATRRSRWIKLHIGRDYAVHKSLTLIHAPTDTLYNKVELDSVINKATKGVSLTNHNVLILDTEYDAYLRAHKYYDLFGLRELLGCSHVGVGLEKPILHMQGDRVSSGFTIYMGNFDLFFYKFGATDKQLPEPDETVKLSDSIVAYTFSFGHLPKVIDTRLKKLTFKQKLEVVCKGTRTLVSSSPWNKTRVNRYMIDRTIEKKIEETKRRKWEKENLSTEERNKLISARRKLSLYTREATHCIARLCNQSNKGPIPETVGIFVGGNMLGYQIHMKAIMESCGSVIPNNGWYRVYSGKKELLDFALEYLTSTLSGSAKLAHIFVFGDIDRITWDRVKIDHKVHHIGLVKGRPGEVTAYIDTTINESVNNVSRYFLEKIAPGTDYAPFKISYSEYMRASRTIRNNTIPQRIKKAEYILKGKRIPSNLL